MKILLIAGVLLFGPPNNNIFPPPGSPQTWWNLSIRAAGEGNYGLALEYLGRLELKFPDNDELNKQKTILYLRWGNDLLSSKNYDQARDVFFQVLDLVPEHPQALKGLAYASYFRQDLEESLQFWDRALISVPGDKDALEWKKRIQRENKVEAGLSGSRMGNFIFRFSSEAPHKVVYGMEDSLHEAYREIGYDLGYYPSRPIVVILYPGDDFRRISGVPGWIAGIYDGKIRLPAGEDWEPAQFKRILWHEYTHALIHDLTKGRAPTWLQEGLAQYEEAKVIPIDDRDLLKQVQNNSLIPLASLNGSFAFRQDPQKLRLAYLQAYSLVDYMINEFGFWRVNAFLAQMKEGASWREAFKNEFLISLEEFEHDWESSI